VKLAGLAVVLAAVIFGSLAAADATQTHEHIRTRCHVYTTCGTTLVTDR
jgi:hypothetical protein